MVKIKNYIRPDTMEEAYRLLNAKKSNTILGGGTFLRLGSKNIDTAIDLSRLGLDYIKETDNALEIGAMATLRDIETSVLLQRYGSGVLPRAVGNIVGIQFRSLASVGGTVYSRYGFSDFNTALLAVADEVVLYHAGRVSIREFMKTGARKDILEKIILPGSGEEIKASYQQMRNSCSDFPILTAAVSRRSKSWTVVVGARPGRSAIAEKASELLTNSSDAARDMQQAAALAAEELAFGTNMRGSGAYRKALCEVLVRRAIGEVLA